MKKHLSMILALLILFALPVSAFAALEQVGGVYQISTSEDLGLFRNMVNNGSGDLSAKLTASIDLNGAPWTPIGLHVIEGNTYTDYSYRGTFDGNGFAIQNLTVTSDDLVAVQRGTRVDRAAGLFGVLSKDAHISDLSFEGVLIDASDYSAHYVYVGAVAGLVLSGDIQNCTVQSADINAQDCAGGVAGYNYGGDIQSCTVTGGTITGNYAGGVAGVNWGGDIQTCTVTDGSISGPYAGGVAGYNGGGDIQSCTVTGGTRTAANSAGGVVGENYGDIQSCTVTGGTITSGWYAGGVAGRNEDDIQTCIVTGGTISSGWAAGGVAGRNAGNIQTCIVTGGTISSGWVAGGVVGHMSLDTSNVQNCAIFGVSISAEDSGVGAYSGAIVGEANSGTIRNCVAMDGEKTRVSASADVATKAYAGGALGWIHTTNASISYTYYPAGIVYSKDIYSAPQEWAIGNVPPASMDTYGYKEVTSYNAELSADKLPSITAILEQGIAVTIKQGASYELDVTTLPGTSGDVACAWSIEGEDTGILTMAPATGLKVTVTGQELGVAVVKCAITGDITLDLTCRVTVVEADPTPTPTGGSSSSTCNSGVGAAFFALAGLFFIGKKKK